VTSTARRFAAGALALFSFCIFLALGTWQVERRAWKLDLIDRVERRVHAAPTPAPPRPEWPLVSRASHEYRHVRVTGVFLPESQTRVQALTERGSGFWVMTALREPDGSIVLVNRGFVAADEPAHAAAAAPPDQPVSVTGLLRMTEPGGGFLRHNEPAADRWYSRDVQAIAAARGLGVVAPYFIDADRAATAHGGTDVPVGGLTVIAFYNNHLIYAITWYTLAAMIPAALWFARRSRQRSTSP
jgi:surfeit locus 1 family protein